MDQVNTKTKVELEGAGWHFSAEVTPDPGETDPVPAPLTVRITEMFNILSSAKFIIEQHLPDVDGGDSYIVFRGEDTSSAEESDLVITVPRGYGSAIDKTFPGTTDVATGGVDAQGSPVYSRVSWTAKITKETPTTQSVLTIPKEAIEVDFFWFVGIGEDGEDLIADSYWVDANGTRHPFNMENTPPDNLVYGAANINGVHVDPSYIREIHFLDDYPMVEAPDAFLNRAGFCEKLTLPTGLVKVGDSFLEGIGAGLTEGVERIIFPRGLTTVGMYALYAAKSPYVELPQRLESIGFEFCNLRSGSPRGLQIGSLNAESIAGDTTGAFGQNPEFTIYADTLELGEAFKAKFTALANCPVVVNE